MNKFRYIDMAAEIAREVRLKVMTCLIHIYSEVGLCVHILLISVCCYTEVHTVSEDRHEVPVVLSRNGCKFNGCNIRCNMSIVISCFLGLTVGHLEAAYCAVVFNRSAMLFADNI